MAPVYSRVLYAGVMTNMIRTDSPTPGGGGQGPPAGQVWVVRHIAIVNGPGVTHMQPSHSPDAVCFAADLVWWKGGVVGGNYTLASCWWGMREWIYDGERLVVDETMRLGFDHFTTQNTAGSTLYPAVYMSGYVLQDR